MQIEKVYLIVHPLYRQSQIEDSKEKRIVTQNEMDNYGRIIKEAKKTPNSIVILVPTKNKDPLTRQKQARLLRFARKEMGGRVLSVSAEIGHKQNSFFEKPRHIIGSSEELFKKEKLTSNSAFNQLKRKLSKFQFRRSVKIVATGQYRDKCVETGANNLRDALKKEEVRSSITFRKESKTVNETRVLLGTLYRKRPLAEFSDWRRRTFGKRK